MSSATLIAGQYAIHRGKEEGGGEETATGGGLRTLSLTIENLLVLSGEGVGREWGGSGEGEAAG